MYGMSFLYKEALDENKVQKDGHIHTPPIKMYIFVVLLIFKLPFLLS